MSGFFFFSQSDFNYDANVKSYHIAFFMHMKKKILSIQNRKIIIFWVVVGSDKFPWTIFEKKKC